MRYEQPLTTAGTRLVCLLGHPVSHSMSPPLHDAALRAALASGATKIDARYLAFDVPPERIIQALEGLVALGFLGCNATIPHKQAIYDFADARTDEAKAVGVANTLYWEGQRLMAHNTDATGLASVLRDDCHVSPGTHVHIYGAGGAARAAAVGAGRLQAYVTVSARRPDQAAVIADLARVSGGVGAGEARPHVTINATPLGRHGEHIPDAHLRDVGHGQIALDLNYEASPYLERAQSQGATIFDGAKMLIAQAEQAFACWVGIAPVPGLMADVWHNLERS